MKGEEGVWGTEVRELGIREGGERAWIREGGEREGGGGQGRAGIKQDEREEGGVIGGPNGC